MQFLIPVVGPYRISQTFAEHVARRQANGWPPGSYNGGIDYAIVVGTPIVAAQAGIVQMTRLDAGGYGWHVRVQHADGYLSIYAHLSKIEVVPGQQLQAGEVVGLSGNTGNSTGPHLHFEVRLNGAEWNPEPYMVERLAEEQPRPEEIPALPSVRVKPGITLTLRRSPRVAANNAAGRVSSQDGPLHVMQIITVGSDVWLQIGHQQYIAETHRGVRFVEWVASSQ